MAESSHIYAEIQTSIIIKMLSYKSESGLPVAGPGSCSAAEAEASPGPTQVGHGA